jgi:hypothetical protein
MGCQVRPLFFYFILFSNLFLTNLYSSSDDCMLRRRPPPSSRSDTPAPPPSRSDTPTTFSHHPGLVVTVHTPSPLTHTCCNTEATTRTTTRREAAAATAREQPQQQASTTTMSGAAPAAGVDDDGSSPSSESKDRTVGCQVHQIFFFFFLLFLNVQCNNRELRLPVWYQTGASLKTDPFSCSKDSMDHLWVGFSQAFCGGDLGAVSFAPTTSAACPIMAFFSVC